MDFKESVRIHFSNDDEINQSSYFKLKFKDFFIIQSAFYPSLIVFHLLYPLQTWAFNKPQLDMKCRVQIVFCSKGKRLYFPPFVLVMQFYYGRTKFG